MSSEAHSKAFPSWLVGGDLASQNDPGRPHASGNQRFQSWNGGDKYRATPNQEKTLHECLVADPPAKYVQPVSARAIAKWQSILEEVQNRLQ